MHPDTRAIAEHMKDFGLCALAKAIVDVTFSEMLAPYAHPMGLVRCAHAAEIIIKARIAEEHPLLIFTKLPRPGAAEGALLGIDALLSEGKTLMYSDLPDALWGATGYKVLNRERFIAFGNIRNMITHFAIPNIDLSAETLRFAFTILEPMIYEFWKQDIYDYIGKYDDDGEDYVKEQLRNLAIPINNRA